MYSKLLNRRTLSLPKNSEKLFLCQVIWSTRCNDRFLTASPPFSRFKTSFFMKIVQTKNKIVKRAINQEFFPPLSHRSMTRSQFLPYFTATCLKPFFNFFYKWKSVFGSGDKTNLGNFGFGKVPKIFPWYTL